MTSPCLVPDAGFHVALKATRKVPVLSMINSSKEQEEFYYEEKSYGTGIYP